MPGGLRLPDRAIVFDGRRAGAARHRSLADSGRCGDRCSWPDDGGAHVSLSRSGLFGGTAAACVFAILASRRVSGSRMALSLVGFGVLVAAASFYVNLSALADGSAHAAVKPWRTTDGLARDLAHVRDFPLTGMSARSSAPCYQQSTRLIFFNHAQRYLQVLVEADGYWSCPQSSPSRPRCWPSPIGCDRQTPIFWIRVGAASGLAAVAAQSVWDTGLRMPASAVLFAIVAAAALHDQRSRT